MNDTPNRGPRRAGRVERITKETTVQVEIDLDGSGKTEVAPGSAFFDHMLDQLAGTGCFDLTVRTDGDLEIDTHHTIEDTALALGQALREALGDKSGICRFGDAAVPLDETLARAAVDLSGRPYLVHAEPDGMAPLIGTYDTTLTRHFFESRGSTARDLPAPGGDRAQPAPHRGGAVQGGGPGAARGRGPRPPGARHPQHQGCAVTRPRVVVLDYGSGNIRSAQRALERAGADTEVTADWDTALAADGLVVPGVGAFAACMAGLREVRGDQIIDRRLAGSRPVLGICVGMQVMFDEGVEHGLHTKGCGQWPGIGAAAARAGAAAHGLEHRRRPRRAPALRRPAPGTRFYFVHSYAALRHGKLSPGSSSLAAPAAHLGGPRGAVRRRRGERPAVRHAVPPGEVRRRGRALLANWNL